MSQFPARVTIPIFTDRFHDSGTLVKRWGSFYTNDTEYTTGPVRTGLSGTHETKDSFKVSRLPTRTSSSQVPKYRKLHRNRSAGHTQVEDTLTGRFGSMRYNFCEFRARASGCKLTHINKLSETAECILLCSSRREPEDAQKKVDHG